MEKTLTPRTLVVELEKSTSSTGSSSSSTSRFIRSSSRFKSKKSIQDVIHEERPELIRSNAFRTSCFHLSQQTSSKQNMSMLKKRLSRSGASKNLGSTSEVGSGTFSTTATAKNDPKNNSVIYATENNIAGSSSRNDFMLKKLVDAISKQLNQFSVDSETYESNLSTSSKISSSSRDLSRTNINGDKKVLSKIYLDKSGCKWTAMICKTLNNEDIASKFLLEVECSLVLQTPVEDYANNYHIVHINILPPLKEGMSHYSTLPNDENEENAVSKSNLSSFQEYDEDSKDAIAAREVFDFISLELQKTITKCQFPVFPEGSSGKSFKSVYQLNKKLQSGGFATVCRGTHRERNFPVAIKCVFRKDLSAEDEAKIYEEVCIMASLQHDLIIDLVDFFEEKECFFLVMELMEGGDLFDRIGQRKSYSEKDARILCNKLLRSIHFCHESQVAHCDIKPKNLLLKSQEDDHSMKLADFGFASRVTGPRSLSKQCGTPYFVAPEILQKKRYDEMADMWSIGVLVFLLLGGELPFTARSFRDLFKKIVKGDFNFVPKQNWEHVSEDAKDLVKNLLRPNSEERYNSAQALDCAWFTRSLDKELEKNDLNLSARELGHFNARLKMRSAMIAVHAANNIRNGII